MRSESMRSPVNFDDKLQYDTEQRLRNNLTAKILGYYSQLVEGGKEGHKITMNEASQILGCPTDELPRLIKRATGSNSLNDLLDSLGLPHKYKTK